MIFGISEGLHRGSFPQILGQIYFLTRHNQEHILRNTIQAFSNLSDSAFLRKDSLMLGECAVDSNYHYNDH